MIKVREKCMQPLPVFIAGLAAEASFPKPINPDDPDSSTILAVGSVRKIRTLIVALTDYIQTELARCATTPETP